MAEVLVSNLPVLRQEQTNWCWAAVAQAVVRWSGSPLTQSQIVAHHVSRGRFSADSISFDVQQTEIKSCGANTCEAWCNSPHAIRAVLTERSLLDTVIDGANVEFKLIKNEIDDQRPVPCRVKWDDGGAHFVCVVGYAVDEDEVEGAEPFIYIYDSLLPGGVGIGEAEVTRVRFSKFLRYRQAEKIGSVKQAYLVRR